MNHAHGASALARGEERVSLSVFLTKADTADLVYKHFSFLLFSELRESFVLFFAFEFSF